uniref:Uncharacterized protein n=1 Tax=Seriola dumerili TaxID=41447 RepID=A0A3B4UPK3_SERDU
MDVNCNLTGWRRCSSSSMACKPASPRPKSNFIIRGDQFELKHGHTGTQTAALTPSHTLPHSHTVSYCCGLRRLNCIHNQNFISCRSNTHRHRKTCMKDTNVRFSLI